MTDSHHLLVVAGPTGIGKTDLAINLALHYNAEILSADSRQFFREMTIGTAKPSIDQLKTVKHYFIDSLSIHDEYNAGKFEKEGNQLLSELFKQHPVVIAVGGSGMYLKALCEGINELPAIPISIREKLIEDYKEKGIGFLQDELKVKDPDYYEVVDLHNHQRLIRALEVCYFSGNSFSSFLQGAKVKRPYSIHKIGLTLEREELYNRIELRMDQMINRGLFDEAEQLLSYRHLNALQTVGYTEIFDYLSGTYDREEAIRLLKRNSRRYAKRQMTWFKKDEEVKWFSPHDLSGVINWLNKRIGTQ